MDEKFGREVLTGCHPAKVTDFQCIGADYKGDYVGGRKKCLMTALVSSRLQKEASDSSHTP